MFDTSAYFELDISALKPLSKTVDHILLHDQHNRNSILITGDELNETSKLKLHVQTTNQIISATIKFKNGEEKDSI